MPGVRGETRHSRLQSEQIIGMSFSKCSFLFKIYAFLGTTGPRTRRSPYARFQG